jgi:hypothetical protein
MDQKMHRRDFTVQSALAVLGGVAITIAGCSDSASPSSPTPAPSPAPSPGPTGDVSGTVSANHGHTAVVTAAQLTAGNTIAVDIMGNADHTHRVELDPSELSAIASGQRLSKLSTIGSAHNHTVTFN